MHSLKLKKRNTWLMSRPPKILCTKLFSYATGDSLVIPAGKQHLCIASIKFIMYSWASSCLDIRKLRDIPFDWSRVSDFTKHAFQLSNIDKSKSKHKHFWIHRKFLTRVVGDKILPDESKAIMTWSCRAHMAQNPATRPSNI